MIGVYISIGLVAVLILYTIVVFNGLVTARNQAKNAWSQIDVQLKRRYDLIPNLVETVKGFLKHERETLEAVIKARQVAIDAKGVGEQGRAEGQLTSTLRSLFAVAESYPELKANQNMLALQEELSSTENRIGFARQHYNDSTLEYNNRIHQFPSNIVGSLFGFRDGEYFEVEAPEERKAVKVQF
jgi:LemA protein